ncbi:trans-aconitate methyltransferase 1 [Thecaphora frezii]
MTTFAHKTFDAASYLAFRATYPPWLYAKVLERHAAVPAAAARTNRPQYRTCVDLGCGPGISTILFAPHFAKVIGVDPSPNMVEVGIRPDNPTLPDHLRPQGAKMGSVEYQLGSAEDLSFAQDHSLDLVVAAQAAHWFDYAKLWTNLTRKVAPGGSVVFWGYQHFFLPDYPQLTQMLLDYNMGPPPDGVGTYYAQPGRSVVDGGLTKVPWPFEIDVEGADQWSRESATRLQYSTLGLDARFKDKEWPPEAPDAKELCMDQRIGWEGLAAQLKTSSAYHSYCREHPEDGEKIIPRFIERLRESVEKIKGGPVEELLLRRPLVILSVKKQ